MYIKTRRPHSYGHLTYKVVDIKTKDMSINEGNKLIFLFDGWVIEKGMESMKNPFFNKGFNMFLLSKAEFHTSWDWLMPVAFKIKCWGVPEQKTLEDQLKLENEAMKLWESIAYACACINIEMVYTAVIVFLQWHKSHFPESPLTYKSISTQK